MPSNNIVNVKHDVELKNTDFRWSKKRWSTTGSPHLKKRSTVKPMYNGQPWDPKIEAVVDRWLLFRGSLNYTICNWDHKIEAVVARWPLFRGGR
jgi:hypothetical protein